MGNRTKKVREIIVSEARENRAFFALLSIVTLVLTPKAASAYLDAGTGSYIIQIAIASLAAALFSIKIFWRRMTLVLHEMWSKIFGHKGNEGK